jgi:5'-nucleotidase
MSRKRWAGTLGLGLAVSAITLLPAPSYAVSSGLVISEVFGGGGNAGAPLSSDYVELYNPTAGSIDLSGLSLQARAATGSSAGAALTLSGSVAAGGHYLVQTSAAGANGVAIPTADASATWTLGATGGQVLLVNGTSAFSGTGDLAGASGLVDMVGWGTTGGGSVATSFETARGATTANTTALLRSGADSDNNSTDFASGAPAPQNSGDVPPPVEPTDATIAEIQGTGAASPLDGVDVVTEGVNTALYHNGGFNGFYLQTPGTGGDTADATPGASDGVFVYGQSVDEGLLAIGDHVEVTGTVAEYTQTVSGQTSSLTQVVPGSDADVVVLDDGATAPEPLVTPWFTTDAEREAHEGELVELTNDLTVTNSYATGQYGEIGLATGTTPLIAPTEVEDAQTGDVAGVAADNARRLVTLDDGRSSNFAGVASGEPATWLSPGHTVRVGADVTLHGAFVVDHRNGLYKLQPTTPVVGEGDDVATIEQTRTERPEDVGGDIRLATFNVLNYFPTTGQEWIGAGTGRTCTSYDDRAGNPITVNACKVNNVSTSTAPRGAWNTENLERQRAKSVDAIIKLGASIVSLEEIENSAKFGKDRDFALRTLVTALNTKLGSDVWAFVPSPSNRLPVSEEDVIRTAFIYKVADVAPVGESMILRDEVNFANAREPLAQAFKKKGAPNRQAFGVIVNHFKSKGSGTDDGTGQGNANPDRVGQANALKAFAETFKTARGVKKLFLVGDFNSYSMEDPMQVLYAAGYTAVESDTTGEETYNFGGLAGSLDHVLANAPARRMVTGADVWNINSVEPVAYQYSRYNYNVTDLYAANPFASSDHDPEVVGLNTSPQDVDVQVLATNDFHGRIAADPQSSSAGAAVLAGAVKQLRSQNPDTVFAAAGDLIGASTFESFIQHDKPTIDALNSAGLEVSAVGNHEFDQGYDDLVNRVMAAESDQNPYGGAEWKYLGANVKFKDDGSDALDGTWIKDMDGVQVGFVGAVTEHLPELVSPAGISTIKVTDIVDATNAAANDLKAEGADVVVLLVHEGASGTDCATMDDDPTSDFGSIIHGVNDNVDAIVSGHTHLEYNCSFPVPGWAGRAVTERPVVSAGQYGTNLNKLVFTVDPDTGEVVSKTQTVLKLKESNTGPNNYPVDQPTQDIVDAAVAAANVLGAQPLGTIAGPFDRARFVDLSENRGGESTLGNLVAEVQRWATESPTTGSAQIAFMNPGGLRDDLRGTVAGDTRTVTYRQAANIQPFANTLVNMDLTGAQIKQALEQQWQPAGASRPFLRLGSSAGFEYTYDPDAAAGSRITGMWLDGEKITAGQTYSVTVNSFLASGGDNFGAFATGTGKQDTGQTDLEAMVDYMAEFASDSARPVDFEQHAVGVDPADPAPAEYHPGDDVTFDVSSWSMTGPTDAKDTELQVKLGDEVLGTFPVTTTLSPAGNANSNDEAGKASVTVTLPQDTPAGATELTLVGATTGTTSVVPIQVAISVVDSTVSAADTTMVYGSAKDVAVTVTPGSATGTVTLLDGTTELDSAAVSGGSATLTVAGDALAPGSHVLTLRYGGDATTNPSQSTFTVTVARATADLTMTRTPQRVVVNKRFDLTVAVDAGSVVPTGTVQVRRNGGLLASGTLVNGSVTLGMPRFNQTGDKTVRIVYSGDAHVDARTEDYTFTVFKR